ncbi:MAG: hypothetical protein ABI619_01545 [Betaproteobacteria bacterium]
MTDNLSLIAKAKQGDYAAGKGSKASVELGWGGGSHDSSHYNLGLAGDFSTDADGKVNTTLTKDEFDIDADSGGGGNDWFRTKYDAKTDVVTDRIDGGWTKHNETKSDTHESATVESNGNSSFLLGLTKPTGGAATGSVSLTFGGGSGDAWHVDNYGSNVSDDRYDDGIGSTGIHKDEAKNKYKVDDVYGSSYRGDPSASLNADGSTSGGGSSHADAHDTFDQVLSYEDKSRDETWYLGGYDGYQWSEWHKREHERTEKTTDHYEAATTSDAGPSATSATLAGSDDGYTDHEILDNSCHTWDSNGTPGGPDCFQSTWTDHEDWPSRVDAVLAMMETEADGETTGEGGDGGGGSTTPCATCLENGEESGDGEGDGNVPDNRESGTTRVPLTIALNNCITGFTADNRPVPCHYAPPLRVVIVTNHQASGPDWNFRWDFGFLTPMKFGVSSLQEMISYLGRFRDGSIDELIISGHTGSAGCGVSVVGGQNIGSPFHVGNDVVGPLVRADSGFPLNISARNITGDLARAIRQKLSSGANVRLLSCNAGVNEASLQFLANNLQATILANKGLCGGTGDDDVSSIWVIVRPDGPPCEHSDDVRD